MTTTVLTCRFSSISGYIENMSRRKQNRKYTSLPYARKFFIPLLILIFIRDSNYKTYFLIRPELLIRNGNDQKYQQRCNRYFYFLSWRKSPQWARTSSLSRLHGHTHLDTQHLVGLLWTSDQHDLEIST